VKSLAGLGSVRSPADAFPCRVQVEVLSEIPAWPANDRTEALFRIWNDAAARLELPLEPEKRGGLSDGNWIWDHAPTLDGLGPHGDNDHCSERSADGTYPDDAEAGTPIRLMGSALSPDGTYNPFSREIVMTIACVASWCGAPPPDEEIFAAVRVAETGPELWIGPCPWHAIPYTPEDESRLLSCVRDGDCQRR